MLASDEAPGYREIPFNKSHPKMFSPGTRSAPRRCTGRRSSCSRSGSAKEIYITENGCAADDELAADGNVYDTDRVMFLRNYLTQLQRATAEGVPVKGYFLWSRWTTSSGPTATAPVRHRARRLQDAEAHAEDQRVVLPGSTRRNAVA